MSWLTVQLSASKKGIYFHGSTAPGGPEPPHYRGFTIALRHTTIGGTPLDEGSARRRDLDLETHDTRNRHPFPGGIRTHNPKRPQTHALDRAAAGIAQEGVNVIIIKQA